MARASGSGSTRRGRKSQRWGERCLQGCSLPPHLLLRVPSQRPQSPTCWTCTPGWHPARAWCNSNIWGQRVLGRANQRETVLFKLDLKFWVVICSNVDGSWSYHTKWSKPRETNIIWYCLYVKSKKKWYKWTYIWNRNRPTDILIENKLMVIPKGKGRGGLNWGLIDTHCYM